MIGQAYSSAARGIEAAVEELKALIRSTYDRASFEVVHGDDPEGVYLIAIVDVADRDAVIDCYAARLLEFQVDEELPLYVIPLRPPERVLADRYPNPPRASALAD
jgi:hypothetical protein